VISRQKLTGWILIAVPGALLIYFLKTRLLAPGPLIDRQEWMQVFSYVVLLMMGTINVRMAVQRERKRK
jgi:hypothetical protein